MSAFFSSIRRYFKSKYNGRYLSLILREIAVHEPRSFSLIIDQIVDASPLPFWKNVSRGILDGELTINCEHAFAGRRKKRRADLAILRGKEALVLMEVKEFDHLAAQNPEQLSDYLDKVSEDAGFIHVHRFLPPPKETAKIERKINNGWPVAMLSYDQIYKAIRGAAQEQRALGALLCDYLEEIGVGIYRQVTRDDRKALAFLLAQMLGFPHQAGMGKLQSDATVRRGPQLISLLLSDVEIVGEWVREPNEDIMRTRCATRFWINPWLDHKRLRKNLRDSGNKTDALPKGLWRYVEGGLIYFVANVGVRNGHLATNDYLHLELGFGLELEKAGSAVRFFVYTGFKGRNIDIKDTYEDTNYFTRFPNEQAAFEMFATCLRGSQRKTIKVTSGAKRRLVQQIAIPGPA